jgi:hypothetical protein
MDVSDPENPTTIATYTGGSLDFRDIAIKGHYAYVSDDLSGLMVLDILFPNNIIGINYCNTSGTAESVVVSGDYAFIADGNNGIQVVDIFVPTDPILIGECQIPGANMVDVTVTGETAYAVDETAGTVKVIDLLPTN